MPYGPPPSEESSTKRLRKSRTKSFQVSIEFDQPLKTMTLARGIRAMIRAAETDDAVRGVVLDVLRTDQS
jgi:hypothetical protein